MSTNQFFDDKENEFRIWDVNVVDENFAKVTSNYKLIVCRLLSAFAKRARDGIYVRHRTINKPRKE